MATDARRKVYEDVGVRPVINCTGHGTIVGGATISPTAWEAMANANHYYVDMRDLFHSTGEIIAPLVGAEAAFVTSGGSAALNLGAAACMTGDDLAGCGKRARRTDVVGGASSSPTISVIS